MLYGNNPLEPTAEPVELYITNEEKLAKDAFDNTHQLLSGDLIRINYITQAQI